MRKSENIYKVTRKNLKVSENLKKSERICWSLGQSEGI